MRTWWLTWWLLAFPLLKILTGVRIRGRVPTKGAYIIACNHRSYLDPPVVGICAGREVYFLAKTGLFSLTGWFRKLIESFNAIPISGTRGLRTAIKLLKNGNVITIFPEGTRSKNGTMLPFNRGVGYLAVNYQIPVIPACVINSNRPWELLALRWHQLYIRYGKAISPRGYACNEKGYQSFTDRIRDEVLALS